MPDASPRPVSRPSRPVLRLPLVALLGVLSMGSGLGNPGSCGPSSSSESEPYVPPVCDGPCEALAGTYRLSYADEDTPRPGCATLGLTSPTELVLSRQGDALAGRAGGFELVGNTYSEDREFSVVLDRDLTLADGRTHALLLVIWGDITTRPTTLDSPAVLTGHYHAYRRVPYQEPPEHSVQCQIERDFTATRVRAP